MEGKDIRNGRARAWVLVQASPAQEVAQGLYDKLGYEGGDSFVVIRADIVAESRGFPYSIIVPVDAESQEMLHQVTEMIEGHPGVSKTAIVQVEQHVPYPPHDAHGYVTEEEAEVGEEPMPAGRLGASPGRNPWG
jgi:hypothetical protein